MASNEEWLPVPGYPGYEVSDHGRVRSLDREVRSRWGTPKTLKGRILTQRMIGSTVRPYHGCTLYRGAGPNQITVHALVLETFVGPRPEGMFGCHRDDNPHDNRLENLYWGTPVQNAQDAIKFGRHPSVAEAAKTHCPQGHEYTIENTYTRPRTGRRYCRICHCEEVKRAYRRSKLKNMH